MSKKEEKKKKKNDAEIKEETVDTATSKDEAKDADAAKTAKADDDGTQKADDEAKEAKWHNLIISENVLKKKNLLCLKWVLQI